MNVVVTGGGTRAPIDDVRAITNTSSGRFSAQITEALLDRGATVWHIHAPGAQLPFARSATLDLDADFDTEIDRLRALHRHQQRLQPRLHLLPLVRGTVAEYEATLKLVLDRVPIDLAILAMAVSDFEPIPQPGKLDSSQPEWTLRCLPTPKVIQSVKDWAPEVFLVGFKLLSNVSEETLVETARRALVANRADLVVANDLQTVREDRHTVHLVPPEGPYETLGPGPDMPGDLADHLLHAARRHMTARPPIPLEEQDPGDAPDA